LTPNHHRSSETAQYLQIQNTKNQITPKQTTGAPKIKPNFQIHRKEASTTTYLSIPAKQKKKNIPNRKDKDRNEK
jgi:hypothetical protein